MFEQFDVYEDGGYIEVKAVDFSSGIEIHGVAYGDVDGIGDFNLDYEVPYPSGNWGDGHNIWEFHGQVQRSFIDFENIEDSLERLIEDYAPTVPSWAYREWEMDKALSDADEADMWDSYGDLVEFLSGEGYSDSEIDEIYQYGIDQNYIMPSKEGSMRKRSEAMNKRIYKVHGDLEGYTLGVYEGDNGWVATLYDEKSNPTTYTVSGVESLDKIIELFEKHRPGCYLEEVYSMQDNELWYIPVAKKAMNKKIGWDSWDSNMLDQLGPAYWSDVETDNSDIYWPETPSEEAYIWANDVTTEEWDSIRKFFDSIGCEVSFDSYGHADIWSSLQHSLDMGLLCDSDSMRYPESNGLWIAENLLEKFNNSPVIGDWLYEIDHEYNVCVDSLEDVVDMYEPETEEWYEERERCIDRYFDKVFPIVENKLIPTLEQMAEEAYKMVDEYVDELAKGYMKDERRQWEDEY